MGEIDRECRQVQSTWSEQERRERYVDFEGYLRLVDALEHLIPDSRSGADSRSLSS